MTTQSRCYGNARGRGRLSRRLHLRRGRPRIVLPRYRIPPPCAGPAHRPVRRHLRSAPRRPSCRLSAGIQAAAPRPRLVAGDARQSAQGYAAGLAPLDERVAAARALARDPRIEVTGVEAEIGVPLQLRHDPLPQSTLSRGPFRLDHGRRQSAQLPSLAELARASRPWFPIAVVDRLGPSLYATRQRRRPTRLAAGASAKAPRRRCRAAAAGLGISARAEIAAVLDGAARDAVAKVSSTAEHDVAP